MKKVSVRPLLWLAWFIPSLAIADLCPEVGIYSNETRQVELEYIPTSGHKSAIANEGINQASHSNGLTETFFIVISPTYIKSN